MDIWVNKTEFNYKKLQQAIQYFGLPSIAIPIQKFLSNDYDVFAFGRPPYAIEIMTAVKGLDFDTAYYSSTTEMVDDIPVRVIHLNQLIEAKKAAGRSKDLNDIENLEA